MAGTPTATSAASADAGIAAAAVAVAPPGTGAEATRQAIGACVHCGFCLPTCPTYLLGGEEMDSPRGRIHLLNAGLEGRAPVSDRFVRHFDSCLGCLACVTACPSGVDYAPVIETARALVERRHRRTWTERLFRRALFAVLPYPRRLRLASSPLGILRAVGPLLERSGWTARLPARVAALVRLGLAVPARAPTVGGAASPAASEPSRGRVGLLTGCVQQVFFDHVNRATVRVLAAEGVETVTPDGLGCCGALALHAGREDEARRFARQTIAAFEAAGIDRVTVNAAGCGSAMKQYGRLLGDDPDWSARAAAFARTVRDVTEVLHDLGPPRTPRHPLPVRLAYHDACHLAHGQGVRQEPRDLLDAIPGLEVVTLAESEICCGSAGIYNLTEPETAATLGVRKVRHISEARPDAVATANPGCLLQIAATARPQGHRWPVLHPIELLDASIGGVDADRLLGRSSPRRDAPTR